MADRRTIKQINTPEIRNDYRCISLPAGAENEVIGASDGLIRMLPNFHEREDENPNRFLLNFQTTCRAMRPHGVDEELLKIRVFPLPLKEKVKDWFYFLLAGTVTSWAELVIAFLDEYFPPTLIA